MRTFRSVSHTRTQHFRGQHRFEHWYRDNSVYFITSKVRDGHHAFRADEAKQLFWDRLLHHATSHGFVLFVATLMSNHYHVLGYLRHGKQLGQFVRKFHGSVAKLTNDLLPQRHLPFWRTRGGHDYFDGCIRDEQQCRRAYRYTLTQCRRHGICADWRGYGHTRVWVNLERAVARSLELRAFMDGVPYPRYERRKY